MPGRVSPLSACVCVLTLAGCPGEPTPPGPDPDPVALVSADGWARITDPSADAFADQRPADAVCDDAGWYVDPFAQSIEIETDVCNYLTLGQTILRALGPNDLVTISGFHDDLSAPEPAIGYLGLALDGELVWELEVPIPAAAAVFEQSFSVGHSVPANAEIQLHVHNHGPNTWEVIAVQVTPARG